MIGITGCKGVILERVTQEKDLGVVIDMGGKQAAQCQVAIGEANRVLGWRRRGINYKSKEVVLTLYRNLVRATSRILCAVLRKLKMDENFESHDFCFMYKALSPSTAPHS